MLDHLKVVFDKQPTLPRRVTRNDIESLAELSEARESAANERAAEAARVQAEIDALPPPPEVPDVDVPAFAIDLEGVDAWQTMEALRLGVVPARGVRDYTVARREELEDLGRVLERGRGCRVLWGDYGTGKTHLLEAAEQLALEQGYATSRVTLDPRENALHHPLRLYKKIVESARTLNQVTAGFEPLLEPLLESPEHYRPDGARASRFLSPYLHALRNGDAEHIGWLRDYVRGDNVQSKEVNAALAQIGWQGKRVLQMSDFRTYGRMYIHMVGNFASWVRDAGARGLILLFDEVERVDALSRDDQHYAFEVLRHYAAVTMEADDLEFDPEDLYKGGQPVHREIPLTFTDDQPLISVFALTPLEEIAEGFRTVTKSTTYDLRLRPLESGLLPELVGRIASLYERAYPQHKVVDSVRNDVHRALAQALDSGHDSFRDAGRACVFLFDENRLIRPGRTAG